MTLNDDTKKIKQQRDKILEGKTGDNSILSLFYLAAVQQNNAHFNQLNNQLNKLKSKEDEIPAKERGRNNFPNYASQLQAAFVRSQITKILK